MKFFEATGARKPTLDFLLVAQWERGFLGMQHLFGLEWPRRGGGGVPVGARRRWGRGGRTQRSTSVTVVAGCAGGTSRGTSNKGRGGYRFLKSGPSGNGSWRAERKLSGSRNNLGDRKVIEGLNWPDLWGGCCNYGIE